MERAVRIGDERVATPRPAFAPFLVYVALFHLAWAAWPYVVYPKLAALGEGSFRYAILNLSIRLFVWVAPVLLYLRYIDGVDPIRYLKLSENARRGIATAVVLTAINLAGSVARFGPPHLALDRVNWNSVLGTSFLVGFIEEVPYRGFMLRKFAERLGFWPAALVTSLLFLEVHIPGWLALHTLGGGTAVTIFIFGFIMAVAYRFSGSLWAPILTHSANDFASFLLFRQ